MSSMCRGAPPLCFCLRRTIRMAGLNIIVASIFTISAFPLISYIHFQDFPCPARNVVSTELAAKAMCIVAHAAVNSTCELCPLIFSHAIMSCVPLPRSNFPWTSPSKRSRSFLKPPPKDRPNCEHSVCGPAGFLDFRLLPLK